MCKGLVGLCHLMHFVTLSDCVPLPLIGLKDLSRKRRFPVIG